MKPSLPSNTERRSPRQAYLEALGNQVQSVIDQIPDSQEPEMREIVQRQLSQWEIVPTYQNKTFLGNGIVEAMHDLGYLPLPNNLEKLQQQIKLEPDQSPLMWLEEWLQENLP